MDKYAKKALSLFKWTAGNVLAYKKFLHDHKIDIDKIRTLKDFLTVPAMDKENYLRHYPFLELFPNKQIPYMISASSGSSGKPFYWPRGHEQELEAVEVHKKIFTEIFGIGKKRVLVVICFSMGTWVAGTYTANACKSIAEEGYNLSIITPGIDKDDAVAALRNFAPLFEMVIVCGYPPFVADVLSEAKEQGVELKKLNLRLLFAGENFSERWRDIIHDLADMKRGLSNSVGIYGTADAGLLGNETPLTVFLRKKIVENNQLGKELYGLNSHLPTIVQYHPQYKFFEEVGGNLLFTTKAGLPLIRYSIHDQGRLLSFEEVKVILQKNNLWSEVEKMKLDKWKLPFVFLYGRDDVSAMFYALNIYPENIKAGLESKQVFSYVTGKFIIKVKIINNGLGQRLQIAVELKKSVSSTDELKRLIVKSLVTNMLRLNAEYRKLYNSIGERALPEVKLVDFGSSVFQIKKSKHKWVER